MKCKYGFYTCEGFFCDICEDGDNYQMKQEKRGGKRPGAGRKKAEETKTKTFRINKKNLVAAEKKFGRTLNRIINEFIKSLLE